MQHETKRGVGPAAAAAVLLGLLAACDAPPPTDLQDVAPARALLGTTGPATDYGADVPLAGYRLSFELTREEGLTPPEAARAFAYLGVALWEATAPGVPEGRSLAGQLNGLEHVPAPDGAVYWPAVASATLAGMMRRFYTSPASRRAADSFERSYERAFRQHVPAPLLARSFAHANRVAATIWQWARDDGFQQWNACPYVPQGAPGGWQPTPPLFQAPVQPCWGRLRPMVLRSAGSCAPLTHPPYSEQPGSQFHTEAMEVYETVNALTAEERTIALYWADLAGETATPAGHSLSITAQVLERTGATLDRAAEAFARVGIGESDAFIACWETKFHYGLLRPITYINAHIDAGWEPVLDTPPFPAYTSGHSNDAGAASTILTALFGEGFAFTDHTNDALGFEPRSFASFYDAARESAFSRLYGGIHYRSDIEQGLAQGSCVGRAVNALAFRAPFLAGR